jgi:hypothetical protein
LLVVTDTPVMPITLLEEAAAGALVLLVQLAPLLPVVLVEQAFQTHCRLVPRKLMLAVVAAVAHQDRPARVVQAAVALAVQLTALTELQILAAAAVVLVVISAIQQVLAGQVLSLFARSLPVVLLVPLLLVVLLRRTRVMARTV